MEGGNSSFRFLIHFTLRLSSFHCLISIILIEGGVFCEMKGLSFLQNLSLSLLLLLLESSSYFFFSYSTVECLWKSLTVSKCHFLHSLSLLESILSFYWSHWPISLLYFSSSDWFSSCSYEWEVVYLWSQVTSSWH